MATKLRSKMAFLNYENMLSKITSGDLDAYDIVFTPNSKQCYVVSPDLKPWAINSRVYTYDNVISATNELNKNEDTYPGQIVAILSEDKYVGYIVNGSKGHFYVTSLGLSSDIDYNTLGNRPIENITGSISDPILLDQIPVGVYKVTGQYKISSNLDTIFSGNNNTIFYIDVEDDKRYIKKISAKNTTIYTIINDTVIQEEAVTTDYLKEHEYATKADVQEIVGTLDTYVQETTKEYVKEYMNTDSGVQTILQESVEKKIEETIAPVDDSEISDIFS